MAGVPDSAVFIESMKKKDEQRKISSGTLNRLILVAQALESEVDTRRRTEIHGGKVVFAVRMANIVVLILVNGLIFSGLGQFHDGRPQTIHLTPDKWIYRAGSSLPPSFSSICLPGQFVSSSLSLTVFVSSLLVQLLTACGVGNSRLMSIVLSILSVPCCLFVFTMEMHYSACPWLEDQLRRLKNEGSSLPLHQCGINGWALAGIFSLLSCALFVSEGLTSFFRNVSHYRMTHKHITL